MDKCLPNNASTHEVKAQIIAVFEHERLGDKYSEAAYIVFDELFITEPLRVDGLIESCLFSN